MNLTKTQLSKKIAKDIGCTQKKASKILTVILDTIQSTLVEKGLFSIKKFGKFYLTTLNPREIKHPVTGQCLKVGERNVIRFKCYKPLGEAINYFRWSCDDPHNQKILQAIYELIEDSEIEEEDEDDQMYYPGKQWKNSIA